MLTQHKNQAAYRGVAVLAFLENGPAVTVTVRRFFWGGSYSGMYLWINQAAVTPPCSNRDLVNLKCSVKSTLIIS